ncbi:uncharacterized protein LOC112230124 [Oncorhynchus tshawytscha]|uniref:uncharacterized protein LOC112230124 n=1 Tax=Oncorhynchus tshawytscha TaxID=74940 RepID=UPI001C3C4F85|nr:uncharacterized protein LOC112230124 [Oncorhynchus tshawytscha]
MKAYNSDNIGLSSTLSVHLFSDDCGNEGNALLRSCHQVMRSEFFSPDDLCSNLPFWCNWTIQVDPGKRVLLHLEDFTQSDACSGKLDQIHLDEPLGGHRILEKCWREAKYRSLSNILHVVQLIRGKHSPPHRGFYGCYEAFVPPVTYNAYGDTTKEDRKLMTEPKATELEPFPSLRSFTKFLPMTGGEPTEAILLDQPHPASSDQLMVFDYFDQLTSSSASNELPTWEAEEPMVREGPFKFYPFQREEEDWNRGISEGTELDESLDKGRLGSGLSAGVLYILWLCIGGGPEGVKVHRTLHPALQELLEGDVNECVTQLVLCDVNAECVNRFGSYACRCHSGFEDMSRLGSGGTICVDTKAAGVDPHNELTITIDQHSPEQQHCNTGCNSEQSSGMIKGTRGVFLVQLPHPAAPLYRGRAVPPPPPGGLPGPLSAQQPREHPPS